MGKIIRIDFSGGVLFIKAIRKMGVTSTEKYSSSMDRYICPIFLQTLCCVSSFKFQQKVDTVWNYQVKSKNLQAFWHRLF